MRKRPVRPDDENPEWTREDFRNARPLKEAMPELYEALRRYQGQRGPQKAPTKELISLRLDRDIAGALRASGRGWQTRANDALRSYAEKAGLVARERRAPYGEKREHAGRRTRPKVTRQK